MRVQSAPAASRRDAIVQVVERGLNLAESQRHLGPRSDAEVTSALAEVAAAGEKTAPQAPEAASARALLPRPLGGAEDGPGQSAPGFRLRSCSSKRRPRGSRTCRTSSTAGGRGRAAASSSSEGFKSDRAAGAVPDRAAGPKGRSCGPTSPTTASRCSSPTASTTRTCPSCATRPPRRTCRKTPSIHLFEMNLDGSGVRQLTRGRYDDFDARYLPRRRDRVPFDAQGVFLQCSKANTAATRAGRPARQLRALRRRQLPARARLHAARHGRATGRTCGRSRPSRISSGRPAVANDGRILYTRWDYIDRFNGHFFSLWSTNPDGTNPQLVYGNYTVRPQVVSEAVPIPNSQKLVFTAAAHHSILGGSLCLLDRTRGTEEAAPLVRLTPEVPFPETEAWPNTTTPIPGRSPRSTTWWAGPIASCRRTRRVDDAEQNPGQRDGHLPLRRLRQPGAALPRSGDLLGQSRSRSAPRPKPPAYAGVAGDGPQEGALPPAGRLPGAAGRAARHDQAACGSSACRPRSSRT